MDFTHELDPYSHMLLGAVEQVVSLD